MSEQRASEASPVYAERVNSAQQVCNDCGAAMSMMPEKGVANDCAACGARLYGPLSTPPVESLANLCSICRHPLDVEHSGFGCNMPGCHCAATGAGGIDQLEALANEAKPPYCDACDRVKASCICERANAGETGKPSGFNCPKCSQEMQWGGQHNGKPTTWCAKCNQSYGVAQLDNAKPTQDDYTEGRVKCSRPGCKESAHGTINGKPVCDKHASASENANADYDTSHYHAVAMKTWENLDKAGRMKWAQKAGLPSSIVGDSWRDMSLNEWKAFERTYLTRENANGGADCNECKQPMKADGKGGWTGHASGCSTGQVKNSKTYQPGQKGSSSGFRARVKEMYGEGMVTLWLPGGTATVPVEDFIPGDAAYAAADSAGRSAFENASEDAADAEKSNAGRLPCPIDGGSITVLGDGEGQCNKCGRFYASSDWTKELKALPNAENTNAAPEVMTSGAREALGAQRYGSAK